MNLPINPAKPAQDRNVQAHRTDVLFRRLARLLPRT